MPHYRMLLAGYALMPALAAVEPWGNNPSHNMISAASNLPTELNESNLLWHLELDSKWQLPMPHIVDGKLLTGADGRAIADARWNEAIKLGGTYTCRDLETGALHWQYIIPGKGYGLPTYGITTTPYIDGDRIYILAQDQMLCLDLDGLADGNQGYQEELGDLLGETFTGNQTGKGVDLEALGGRPEALPDWAPDILWRVNLMEQYPGLNFQDATSCSLIMVEGLLWVSTSHQLGSEASGGKWGTPKPAPHMLVFDPADGRIVAEDQMQVPIVFHGEWSSPALATINGNSVVVFPDGYGVLHGLGMPDNIPGEVTTIPNLWTWDLNLPEWRYENGDPTGKRLPYTNDKRLFFKYPADYPEGETWAQWDLNDRKKYQYGGPCEVIGMPVTDGARIYVGLGRDCYYDHQPKNRSDGHSRFLCLELESADQPPRLVWDNQDVARTQSTASIDHANGMLYLADLSGHLNGLDLATGATIWRHDIGKKATMRSQFLADGKIYIANDNSDFYVFSAGRDSELLFQTDYRKLPTTVAATNGRLVVTTLDGIRVYTGDE